MTKWDWITAMMNSSSLTHTTRHLLHTLAAHMDSDCADKEGNRGCYPGVNRLAEVTGMSSRAVYRSVTEAKREGWIQVVKERPQAGVHLRSRYIPEIPTIIEKLTDRQESVTEGQESVTVSHPIRREKTLGNSASDNDVDALEVFGYWDARLAKVLPGPTRKRKVTSKRLSKIKARLAEGRSRAELKKAVDGCLGNKRNVDNGFVDIELICRDDQHVTQYIQWARSSGRKSPPAYASLRQ